MSFLFYIFHNHDFQNNFFRYFYICVSMNLFISTEKYNDYVMNNMYGFYSIWLDISKDNEVFNNFPVKDLATCVYRETNMAQDVPFHEIALIWNCCNHKEAVPWLAHN